MASTLASGPRSAPAVSDFGLQDSLQQPESSSNGDQSSTSYQLASSSQTSVSLDYNYPPASSESAPASSSLLPAVPTTTETGLVGFDLSTVSDQLEFPAIPEALLEEAPEYEYSAHTRANVFSDSQLSNYGFLNNLDPYGIPFVPAATDDASWTLSSVEQFGGYDEFGTYHPPSAQGAAQLSLDAGRSEVDIMTNDATARYGDTFEQRGPTRVTPPSAEYANVAASWMPVSISSSSIPQLYADPSSSSASSSFNKITHSDQEPQIKRRKPSPIEGAAGEGSEASRHFTTAHGPASSPASGSYVRSQPLGTTEPFGTFNGYSHTGHRPPQQPGMSSSSIPGEEAHQGAGTSAASLLAPGQVPSQPGRQQHYEWSQDLDASRGPSYRGQPINGYARPQVSGGFHSHSGQLQPGSGGQAHVGPAHHVPSVVTGSLPNGSSPNHGFNGKHLGYESDSFRRNKSGRDSLSQSSEEDDLDAPPPNPKAVALAAAATKGASGTQQQADMLTMLNETLSSSLETDGVARCPFPNCTKTFAKNRSYNLKTHLRSHSQLKPFACASCPRAFSRKHDLERHARVHSGDKPYICEACGRGFPRSDALRRHWRVEKDCGDRASEIEAGQPLPSLPAGSTGLTATAQVPSQMPMSRFNGPNAYPAGWIREQDLGPHHNRGPPGMAGVSMPNNGMSMHMGVKRARHEW